MRFFCPITVNFLFICGSLLGAYSPFGDRAPPPSTSQTVSPDNILGSLPLPKAGTPAPAPKLSPGQLAALALVRGDNGRGSAFFCKRNGQFFVVTNAHVLSGNREFTITDVNGKQFATAEIFLGRRFDVALIRLTEPPPAFLEIMEDPLSRAHIGDRVIVPGNAHGRDVVTQTQGDILGIGPELVEVDAQFVPGNSGSPIIHAGTGKVLGLATFITRQRASSDKDAQTDDMEKLRREPRWFGFRVDTIKEWERVEWGTFVPEGLAMAKVEARTDAFFNLFEKKNSMHQSDDPQIQQALDYFQRDCRRTGMSTDFYRQKFQGLIRDLRNIAAEDVRKFQPVYAYHAERLKAQAEIRESILEALEKLEGRVLESRR